MKYLLIATILTLLSCKKDISSNPWAKKFLADNPEISKYFEIVEITEAKPAPVNNQNITDLTKIDFISITKTLDEENYYKIKFKNNTSIEFNPIGPDLMGISPEFLFFNETCSIAVFLRRAHEAKSYKLFDLKSGKSIITYGEPVFGESCDTFYTHSQDPGTGFWMNGIEIVSFKGELKIIKQLDLRDLPDTAWVDKQGLLNIVFEENPIYEDPSWKKLIKLKRK